MCLKKTFTTPASAMLLFSSSVVFDSLRPGGLQHARLPCPPLSPGVCSDSCPLSWWWHPTISSSDAPLSSCLQSFQHQGLFQWAGSLHQVAKYWSFSFILSNVYSGLISFRIDWFNLLAVWGTLRSLLQHHSSKASILQCSAFFMFQLYTSIHDYWKNHSFGYTDLWWQSDASAFLIHCLDQHRTFCYSPQPHLSWSWC